MRIASCAISLALVVGTLLSLSTVLILGPNVVLLALMMMVLVGALARLREVT